MQEMRGGVVPDAFLAVVGEPALGGFRLRFLLVLGEGLLEALHIDAQAFLANQLIGELDRKAVGVVETERDLAFQHLAAGFLEPLDLLLEHLVPFASVFSKRSFSSRSSVRMTSRLAFSSGYCPPFCSITICASSTQSSARTPTVSQ